MVSKKLESVSEKPEVAQHLTEKVEEKLLEQQNEQITEVVQKSVNRNSKIEDLSKFDKVFESEFWSWDESDEGLEFNCLIKGFNVPKNANYRICEARVRLVNGNEKDVRFIPYQSMETQFKNLQINVGNIVYIKHLGIKSSPKNPNNAMSCVVRKLR